MLGVWFIAGLFLAGIAGEARSLTSLFLSLCLSSLGRPFLSFALTIFLKPKLDILPLLYPLPGTSQALDLTYSNICGSWEEKSRECSVTASCAQDGPSHYQLTDYDFSKPNTDKGQPPTYRSTVQTFAGQSLCIDVNIRGHSTRGEGGRKRGKEER